MIFMISCSTDLWKRILRLQDGDVIFVPFIENSVKLGGAFKRPYKYEFKERRDNKRRNQISRRF